MVLRVPHTTNRTDPGGGDAAKGVNVAAINVGELRHNAVVFARRAVTVPADAEVESQVLVNPPIVLSECIVIVVGVMAVGVALRTRPGVDGRLRKVWVIIRKVGIGLVHDVSYAAVG